MSLTGKKVGGKIWQSAISNNTVVLMMKRETALRLRLCCWCVLENAVCNVLLSKSVAKKKQFSEST